MRSDTAASSGCSSEYDCGIKEAEMTEGGGDMDGRAELVPRVLLQSVSPALVCFKPKITPTLPNGKLSTSTSRSANSRRSLEGLSLSFLVAFVIPCRACNVPNQRDYKYKWSN